MEEADAKKEAADESKADAEDKNQATAYLATTAARAWDSSMERMEEATASGDVAVVDEAEKALHVTVANTDV